MYGASATRSRVIDETWSYRVSAGYFDSDAFARPTGRIPLIADPRIGRAPRRSGERSIPSTRRGRWERRFQNSGTSQPKFDARVDQELPRGRVTYSGGVARTAGTIYTGIGPFDIQSGSVMSYGRMSYTRDALRFNVLGIYLIQVTPRCSVRGGGGLSAKSGPNSSADFATEEAGRAYLEQLRWSEGFRCPRCDGTKAWRVRQRWWQCAGCAHQTSVTAGTILQDTRTPLPTWFRAMWWVTNQKSGVSALGLQRALAWGATRRRGRGCTSSAERWFGRAGTG